MSNWQQHVKNNKHFCILPFTHMHMSTDGKAKVCCLGHWAENIIGDLNDRTFDDIWTSKEYQAIRKDMLDGKPISACQTCYRVDQQGGGSDRSTHNKWFHPPNENWDIDIAQGNTDGKPTWMDLRPGRFCNLGCRMCFSSVSSTFAEEHKKHPELNEITGESWFELDDWIDIPSMYESLQKLIPHIKTIKLAGGEPLFMPGVIKLLKWCIDSGNTHLHLDITTNGTRGKGKVVNWLEKFDSVDIQYSIDGIGYVNDYVRSPSEWNVIKENYYMYTQIESVRSVNILSTVQAYNAFDLENIVDFWKDHNKGILVFNLVDGPADMTIKILPQEDRFKIADSLEQKLNDLPAEIKQQCRVDATLFRLRQEYNDMDDLRYKWAKRTVAYDKIRNEDISKVHPKLEKYKTEWLKINE